jgi:type III pantothenate kinase
MTPFYVADVGNSRTKVGRCDAEGLADAVSLAPDEPPPFTPPAGSRWLVAGVHPERRDRFAAALHAARQAVRLIADYRQVPIRVDVDAPDKVGIDRLLNAVGVRSRVPPGTACMVASVGTAVTVDLIDGEGAFRGGVIFPGFRAMARALREQTAQLPLVEAFEVPPPPGRDTRSAIAGGIRAAVAGGIERVADHYAAFAAAARLFLTGGDAELVGPLRHPVVSVGPFLALEGLRLAGLAEP